MNKFLYTAFLQLYVIGIKLLSIWNLKAKKWLAGRKVFPILPNTDAQTVWMHCASLGEFEQGRPVIENLKKLFPATKIILTFFSPSGYEVQKNYGGADVVLYLPIDSKTNAKRFINEIKPTLVLWIKYEYWFFYLEELKNQQVPVLLISGIFRSRQPFFKWYGQLWKNILPAFTYFFLQDENSKVLLNSIGFAKNITVTGDTRFDRVIEIAENFEALPLIEQFCSKSKVIIAGSTWEDDETELIHYVRANPAIKFIIAPHEIDAENIADVQKEFAGSVLYSNLIAGQQITTNVLIIDNVGILSRLYRYADITFVGGGFGDDGVHNVLEAAVYGKPVIYGPEYEKFIEADELINCGGAVTIDSALELEKILKKLWSNPELINSMGEAAKRYVYSKAGASKKVTDFIYEKRLLTK